jgi:hypothetical protein
VLVWVEYSEEIEDVPPAQATKINTDKKTTLLSDFIQSSHGLKIAYQKGSIRLNNSFIDLLK